FTFTPAPTFTPRPIPTPTPPPNEAAVCAGFSLIGGNLYDGAVLTQGQVLSLLVDVAVRVIGVPDDALAGAQPLALRMTFVHRSSGASFGFQLPPTPRYTAFEFPLSEFPVLGLYDWTLSLYAEPAGVLCPQTGALFIRPYPRED
ncbi:MAG: hypothetical protein GYB67_01995, partial [Chloroflexi bacterium]|nr:hypothetical protein [Chloroflexota bacterium]